MIFPKRLPKANDAFFPVWFNHFVHTNIMVFVMIEMFLLHHNYPCRKSALMGLGVFMLGYLTWVHVIYYNAGKWVYPLLAVLNWPQRIGFYAFTLSVPIVLYYLGEFLNDKVFWPKSMLGEKSSGGKSKSKKSKRV